MIERIKAWLKRPVVEDSLERAGKSALQGFVVGSALDLSGAMVSLTSIDWANGLNFGAGMFVVSVITSLLSYKRRGGNGTASLVKSIEYREADA